MAFEIVRKNVLFKPDPTRVLARHFSLSEERTKKVVRRVLELPRAKQDEMMRQVLRKYSKRHRSIITVFEKNFKRIKAVVDSMNLSDGEISYREKLLIGSYFTMEYSIESAAFFNPSVVEDIDQTQLSPGEKRLIFSFRATGEGHVSSIVFRSAVIDKNLDLKVENVGNLLEKPLQIKSHRYHKDTFLSKLLELHEPEEEILEIIKNKLTDTFIYEELIRYIAEIRQENKLSVDSETLVNQMKWLASSHYEMTYSLDTALSERVIFPLTDTEKRGIEDARFVRFLDDKGHATYYGTYTAYDGFSILPKLLKTKDFIHFKVVPINGYIANKGAALFPRKINGKYAMLCRIDGENNYIAFSDSINNWQEEAILLREPELPWEFIQIGNCGSPIETDKGWLMITHSVGPMREYVLSASLLDIDHPEKILSSLKFPLMSPNDFEREGYVPNVVYSCGSIVHNGHLIIPYAVSDYASTYATVNLEDLLEDLIKHGSKG
ncbi:glycoside hydrolase family 130 protein [Sphingobacterium hungaricum]|uniref:Glycosidase n=1 Tax=Sphingobacterium hungaricum TaxID=2082723 RepID=A0A928UV82_9SPHI|nr:glycoside hydrolase family 130 protein [Sphingobacterium hungaricum]MBE8712176.1 glycosidase [Sphingobacterium hungaricum]